MHSLLKRRRQDIAWTLYTVRQAETTLSVDSRTGSTRRSQVDTSIVSFSQSLCDEKSVGGLLQAPDLAVSDCPEMGESGLHPPPLLRDAEIVPENDHVIARLEVLVPFRVELVEVGQEWEEISDRRVETAIDAPVGESFGNIVLDVIRQERFERIHVSHGGV